MQNANLSPLAGIRVLDLTRVAAGPYATMLLADHGAEVIKIEDPAGGDDTRHFPPFVNGQSTYFASLNRGKRSVVLDLKRKASQELLLAAIPEFDVLIHNFRAPFAARCGLKYETLAALHRGLVCCVISGFGPTGPYADKPAYDLFVAGIGGLMSVTGEPDGPPQRPGINLVDHLAGLNAALGIMLALRVKEQTGSGQLVEVSLLDSLLSTSAYVITAASATGMVPKATTHNQHAQIVPYGTFQTADGYINVGVLTDRTWPPLCSALGHPEWVGDPRFVANRDRVENKQSLLATLRPLFRARTSREWLAELEQRGVPCGPINSFLEVIADPQVRNNRLLQDVAHPEYGAITLVDSPIHLSGSPRTAPLPPPTLGQDSPELLRRKQS